MGSEKRTVPYGIVSAIPGRIRIKFDRRPGCRGWLYHYAQRLDRSTYVLRTRVSDDTFSIVVEYNRAQQSLDLFLDTIQSELWRPIPEAVCLPDAVSVRAAVPHPKRTNNGARHAGGAPLGMAVAILHSIPGRIGLHVPALSGNGEAASRVASELRAGNGIRDVRVQRKEGVVTVRYNPVLREPSAIIRTVRQLIRLMTASNRGRQEVAIARDITPETEAGLHPLLLPSLAAGLALTGIAPAPVIFIVLAAAAMPIAARALDGLRKRRANVDQLDAAALIVLAALGDLVTAGLITWLVGLGDLIRDMTMRRSRRALGELMSPAGEQAWVQVDGAVISVPVQELQADDIVCVYPGDRIPVDGVVVQGSGLVDMKLLTGESTPVLKEAGEPVYALSTLVDGQIAVRAEHIGSATRAGQLAAMIEDAPLSDTRVQNYAAIVGDNLVLPIFGLAILSYLFTRDLFRTASILILDFATGIRVAAPTTILSAMTGAARQGLFIKGGKAIEKLAAVNAVVFDKTGTLTSGEPAITGIHTLTGEFTESDVLRLAASAEANLKHPSAQAVVAAARTRNLPFTPSSYTRYTLGQGVKAVIEGASVRVGSEQYMCRKKVETSSVSELAEQHSQAGDSLVYVAVDDLLIGLVAYSDRARPECRLVLQALRARGVERIVMLTGDTRRAAEGIAAELGITDVIAEAFPERKAEVVQMLREQGFTVAVLGDGVNDSPAFTRADVGISLSHGADVAKETADVILLDRNLWGLPRAIDLARNAITVLDQNLKLVMGPTAGGLVASLFGLTSPLVSTVISNGSTVLAGLNALRPLGYHGRVGPPPSRLQSRGELNVEPRK